MLRSTLEQGAGVTRRVVCVQSAETAANRYRHRELRPARRHSRSRSPEPSARPRVRGRVRRREARDASPFLDIPTTRYRHLLPGVSASGVHRASDPAAEHARASPGLRSSAAAGLLSPTASATSSRALTTPMPRRGVRGRRSGGERGRGCVHPSAYGVQPTCDPAAAIAAARAAKSARASVGRSVTACRRASGRTARGIMRSAAPP